MDITRPSESRSLHAEPPAVAPMALEQVRERACPMNGLGRLLMHDSWLSPSRARPRRPSQPVPTPARMQRELVPPAMLLPVAALLAGRFQPAAPAADPGPW